MPNVLITGAAGFIGSHLVTDLLASGWKVTAVDNFDPFYSPLLKRQNLDEHIGKTCFHLVEADVCDIDTCRAKLEGNFDVIVHLAAKAGIRPSIANPLAYQRTNIQGTQNLLELAREWETPQFVFASSSSVYGINPNVPWSEDDKVLMPISPYASTKISGELLGHVYSHLFGIRFVALRLFTVYGPRQRPDLAIHKFADLIRSGSPIPIYGDGTTLRDYTYVGDIVGGIKRAMTYRDKPYDIFNLANNKPVRLLDLIGAIGEAMGTTPKLEFLPPQPGDVPKTWAEITKARTHLGYRPATPLASGLRSFAKWFDQQYEARGIFTSLASEIS